MSPPGEPLISYRRRRMRRPAAGRRTGTGTGAAGRGADTGRPGRKRSRRARCCCPCLPRTCAPRPAGAAGGTDRSPDSCQGRGPEAQSRAEQAATAAAAAASAAMKIEDRRRGMDGGFWSRVNIVMQYRTMPYASFVDVCTRSIVFFSVYYI